MKKKRKKKNFQGSSQMIRQVVWERKSFYKNRKNLENLRNFLLLQYIGASFKNCSRCLYCWLWRNVNDRLCVHFYWMVSQEILRYALDNGYMTTLFLHVIPQYRFTDHPPHWVRQGLEGAFSPVPSILHTPKKINQSTTGFSTDWKQSTVGFSSDWNQSTVGFSTDWNQSTVGSQRIGTNQRLDSQRIGTNQRLDSPRIETNQRLDSQRVRNNQQLDSFLFVTWWIFVWPEA